MDCPRDPNAKTSLQPENELERLQLLKMNKTSKSININDLNTSIKKKSEVKAFEKNSFVSEKIEDFGDILKLKQSVSNFCLKKRIKQTNLSGSETFMHKDSDSRQKSF